MLLAAGDAPLLRPDSAMPLESPRHPDKQTAPAIVLLHGFNKDSRNMTFLEKTEDE
ncbi:hypothetical protein SAMN05920897_10973 [Alkalispirochaeta americana]|uniref:Alpha/beta hydrolase n=1 Tax=Alkalispirochaeta americana TaxID=159291 RepID=A0A1N6T0L9_9SPIO|nr:hypothetical protein SAMN05920897_10973 [Alkalispirochaeta americana]